jgi:radical SAM superfamily enzyme YgiQ (UPF0313 family)
MRYLRDDFGVRHIHFYDDLFTVDEQRTSRLCELLIRNPLGMQFNCAARADLANDALLALLRRAGCLQISLGVESAAPQLLAQHKRGISLTTVRDTVKRIQAAGMRVKGLFIFGLPGESPDTVKQTSDFIDSTNFDEVNLAKFTPFHGAPLWQECVAQRTGIFHEDWRLMNCLNFCFVPHRFKSAEQMDRLYNQSIQRFYKSWRFHKKLLFRSWQHRWSLWRILKDLPAFLNADKQFKPASGPPVKNHTWPALHPNQPKSESTLEVSPAI